MSLVNQLKYKSSPIRRWFDERTNNKALIRFSRRVNDQLASDGVLIQPKHNQHSTAGMAFDYLFRWQFGPLENIHALTGAQLLRYEVATDVAKALLQKGDTTKDLAVKIRCAVTLSWFEVVYRSVSNIPNPLIQVFGTYKLNSINELINLLLDMVDTDLVDDLRELVANIESVWGNDLQLPFILNPQFIGSKDIPADADWIINRTLFECKTTKSERPFSRRLLFQVLGYTFLDYVDNYKIQKIGWYYPRHKKRISYDLDEVLHYIGFKETLAILRSSFQNRVTTER